MGIRDEKTTVCASCLTPVSVVKTIADAERRGIERAARVVAEMGPVTSGDMLVSAFQREAVDNIRAILPAHQARHTPEELVSLVKSACATYDEMVRLLREAKKDYWCKPGLDDGKPCGSKGCQSCSIAALLATLEGKP
jgi:2-iminoacetate synthase ThiH